MIQKVVKPSTCGVIVIELLLTFITHYRQTQRHLENTLKERSQRLCDV